MAALYPPLAVTTSPSLSAPWSVCVLCVDTLPDTVLTETITVEDVFRAQL